jgi:hypothetical protein
VTELVCRARSLPGAARVAAAVAIVAALGACSTSATRPELGEATAEPEDVAAPDPVPRGIVVREAFTVDGRLTGSGQVGWSTTTEGWSVINGEVALAGAAGSSLALTDLGSSDGVVHVTMPSIANDTGLAFRVVDAGNYWAVAAAPGYATWNLIKVIEGVPEIVANTDISPIDAYTTVGVVLAADRVSVLLNGRVFAEVEDTTHQEGTFGGLFGSGPDVNLARWDDFWSIAVGDAISSAPLPTPERLQLEIPTPTPVPGDSVADPLPTPFATPTP